MYLVDQTAQFPSDVQRKIVGLVFTITITHQIQPSSHHFSSPAESCMTEVIY